MNNATRNGEKPRFHPKAVVPEVPKGMELAKFHGQPVLIPGRRDGDESFGRSRFTVSQAQELFAYERIRREGLSVQDALSPNYQNRLVVADMFKDSRIKVG